MEYLTLQDIPHRQFDPLNPRSMASHSERRHSEKEGSLLSFDAVCEACLPQPDAPNLSSLNISSTSTSSSSSLFTPPDSSSSSPAVPASTPTTPQHPMEDMARPTLPRLDSLDFGLTKSDMPLQDHPIHRNSPPFQPGEQRPSQNTLPSFQQLMQGVREPSPPRTPARRNLSVERSPDATAPRFDEISWQDSKRRRVDTVADIHHTPSASDHVSYDRPQVRPPSFDAPSLLPSSMQPPPTTHHHRPSLPYPTPAPVANARRQSGPHLQGQEAYTQPHASAPPNSLSPNAYTPSPALHGVTYDQRPSYYHEVHPAPHVHAYHRPHEPYYQRIPYSAHHPGYGHDTYHQQAPPYVFQNTLGVDHNSFNRKRRGNLPKEATGILKAWFSSHRESPYPTEEEKVILCHQTNLTLNQVSNWFINARRRAPQKEQREARENAAEETQER
ncbi:hypothetical protein CC78DRAFT_579755 [Lojkania enalia]|uniref:Homeobox domain-containing protein n=1 Tax=Lojkania enalia TaxID=147567 RepID=A0A9P4KAV2_9PLEO|nr:hypothetical protein CC78DRAFT_579755 [Didymosphaeria enalia]